MKKMEKQTINSKIVDENKIIIAEMKQDRCGSYVDNFIPYAIFSKHERFTVGTRFDYGFLQVALEEGFMVIIRPKDAS